MDWFFENSFRRRGRCGRSSFAEDKRDEWGPAPGLHHALELTGIAATGHVLPFLGGLSEETLEQFGPVTRALLAADM